MVKVKLDIPKTVEYSDSDMTVKLTGKMTPERQAKELKKAIPITLNIRRTMGGDLIVYDHRLIDIFVKAADKKIVTLPKEKYDNYVMKTQEDFFDYLVQQGVIDSEDIEGGSLYGSLQAQFGDSINPGQDPLQVVVFAISKWLDRERPKQELNQNYLSQTLQNMVDPDRQDTMDPEDLADREKDLGLQNLIKPLTFNLYDNFPYLGVYYFEE